MDTKKLQHLQQTQNVQKKLPLSYQQTNIADYRSATHSPKVFQQQQQHQQKQQSTGYYMANHNALTNAQYQQSPTTASSMSGPMSPIDMQPHSNKLLLNANMGVQSSNGNTSGSAHSSPYHQVSTSSAYPTSSGTLTEQLYQSPTERTYLAAAGRLHGSTGNPASTLQQQYQQLQQAKLQAQLQTQNEAIQHQQRNFALRQAMNPPVPQNHYHMSQTPSMMSGISQQQSTASQRAHPTTLNINTNTYLAGGGNASTINHQQQQQQHFHHNLQQQSQQQPLVQRRHPEPIYGQHQHQQIQMQLHNQQQLHHQQSHYHPLQQRSKSDLQTPIANSDQSPVYIQQNHPGHVMNQACQTQISAVAKTNQITKTPSSEESSSASVKSPSHAPLDRKKSSGGSASSNTQALKSPLTKRPPSSPVTMSDWLYKQGSDGLKVWRKRWFVLAEYCLYYYKGPEEEKLLGSILLPSYKVSACLPEDKIYRKYAFKCEHQNMRTYWLAAENADSMIQWVRALSAATMMQAPSSSGADSSEQPSAASSSNQSGENSDSGIHTLQSQQSKLSSQGHVTPASDNSGNATGTVVNSNNGVASSGSQPLYANAPPKPRRITDGGYSSPSPENSVDNERRIAHHTIKNHQLLQQHQQQIQSSTLQQLQQHQHQQQQQQQYIHAHNNQNRSQHHAIYDTRTGNVSSTLRIPQHQQQQQQQPPPQHHMSIQSPSSAFAIDALDMQYKQQMSMLNEEYSQNSPNGYMDAQMEAQIMQLQQQRAAIGDDTYGEHDFYMQEAMQQRYPKIHANNYKTNNMDRRTPDAYGRSNNRIFSDYEDIYNLTQGGMMGSNTVPMSAQEALLQEAASYRRPLSPTIYDRNKHIPTMPAHFTTNHIESTLGQHLTGSSGNMRAKPVSSIMRPHSADFLEYESRPEITSDTIMPSNFVNQTNKSDPVRTPRPKSSLDINRTPDSFYYSEENYAEKMRKSALYLQNPQSHVQNLAQPQQASPYKTLSSSNDYLNSNSGMHTIGYENPYERAHKRNELLHDALANTTGHTSIPRLNRGQMLGAGSHVRSHSIHPHIKSPDQQSGLTGLTTQQIIQQNEQFLRSASARLPKRANSFDDGPQSPTSNVNNVEVTIAPTTSAPNQNTNVHNTHLEGERKREESMKRLLEWKQRMLQSPLTRKSTHSQRATSIAKNNLLNNHKSKHSMSAVSQLGSNPNLLVSSHSMATGGTHYSSKRTSNISSNITLQRSRSESHANTGPSTGYNSYSSDDEDNTGGHNKKAPAGRFTLRSAKSINSIHKEATTANNVNKNDKIISQNSFNDNDIDINDISNIIITTTKNTVTATTTTTTTTMATTATTSMTVNKTNPKDKMVTLFNDFESDSYNAPNQSALKPILKTKIINVKPLKQIIYDNNSIEIYVDRLSQQTENLHATLSLPKTTNAIDTNKPRKDNKMPKCKSVEEYQPVYITKALIETNASKCSNNVTESETSDSNLNLKQISESQKPLSIINNEKSFKDNKADSVEVNAIDTECIQDAEATPILMSLKMFKEKLEESKDIMASNNDNNCIKSLEKENEVSKDILMKDVETENEDNEETACEYTDDDLDEALAAEDNITEQITEHEINSRRESQIYQNEPIIHPDESHYCLMTPKRSIFGQLPDIPLKEAIATTTTTISTVTTAKMVTATLTVCSGAYMEEEENHYVEMTKQLRDDDSKSSYEYMSLNASNSLTSVGSATSKATKVQNEPVYMELPACRNSLSKDELRQSIVPNKSGTIKKTKKLSDVVKKKSKKSSQERNQTKRKDLPDIVKPSQSKLALNSDSSDADDESSKNIELKKMNRSRSRFSLSDTFRPASYYLGASTPLEDCAESSDSEIVPPPPIPDSPPPLEELNRTEEIFSSENYDTVKRRNSGSNRKLNLSYDALIKIHSSNSSLNIPKTEGTLKSSRLSLPDQFSKTRLSRQHLQLPHSHAMISHHERTLSDSNYSFQTDNSSNTSSDFDLYNKLKQNSPSFAATPVRYSSNNCLTQKYITTTSGTGNSSETDSVELRHRQSSDTEFDRQRSRRPLSEESISEIESLNEKYEDALGSADLDSYLNDLQNSDIYMYQNKTYKNRNTCLMPQNTNGVLNQLIKPPKIFRTKEDEHFYGNIHFVSSTDSLQKLSNEINDTKDIKETLQSKRISIESSSSNLLEIPHSLTPTRYMTPLHSRNNSNISEQSAPYYYSELTAHNTELLINTTQSSSNITLNNQRDIHATVGVNIAHIHNPIERAPNINVDILTDKEQTFDSRNLYKMKTNIEKLSYSNSKNLKTGEPLHQSNNQIFHLQQMESAQTKINNYHHNVALPNTTYTQQSPTMSILTSMTQVNSNNSTTSSTQAQVQISAEAQQAAITTSAPSILNNNDNNNNNNNSNNITSNYNDKSNVDIMVMEGNNVRIAALSEKNTNIQMENTLKPINMSATLTASVSIPGVVVTKLSSVNYKNTLTKYNEEKLSVTGAPLNGELLWEEDALWRESLRRVSQRHARSLDDLDRIPGSSSIPSSTLMPLTTTTAALCSMKPNANVNESECEYDQKRENHRDYETQHLNTLGRREKTRLSREVTYVNDNISQQMQSSFKKHNTELVTSPSLVEFTNTSNTSLSNEHDVYVQLSENPIPLREINSELYEVLREETESNISSNKSAEIDRETIRQWDSMSSGLMKGPTTLHLRHNLKSDMELSDNNIENIQINSQTTPGEALGNS